MKRIFIIGIVLLTLLCGVSSCSYSTKATSKYRDVDDGVALYRYSGVSTVNQLTVPDTYEEKPVKNPRRRSRARYGVHARGVQDRR